MRLHFLIIFALGCLTNTVKAQSFDPNLAARLQNTIDSIRSANNIQGVSACIIYPGMGMWKGVSGFSHSGSPISPVMEFGIASNTKLFTGVLLLKLAEHNLINLDDSLHEFLPTFANVDSNISIRQLLNHTSGLYDVISVPGYPDSIFSNPNRIFTPDELISWAEPPLFTAGTGWDYCNTNYLLAGMIAESITGFSYGQLLHDSILNPLQLDSTFLDVYDSVLFTVAHPWQAGVDNFSIPRKALNSAAWAAGAMYSTAGEMAQWYEALMNGQVLNSNSMNEMCTFVGSGNYGIGISETVISGRTVWLHGGQIWGGYNSNMMYDIASGVIICVLTNEIQGKAFNISSQLLSNIFANPTGLGETDPLNHDIKAYPNPTNGPVTVVIQKQHLNSIKIFNASGALLALFNDSSFDVSFLDPGLYFMALQTDHSTSFLKLLKQE